MISYTEAQLDDAIRRTLTPWQVSLGVPLASPATGLSWTDDVDNKIGINVAPIITPMGFDLYTTAEGPATRFIGAGVGDTATGLFNISVALGIKSITGRGDVIFKIKTRHYTETNINNATLIDGCHMGRSFTSDSLGSIMIPEVNIEIANGTLIELFAYPNSPSTSFSNVEIRHGGLTLVEIN